MCGTGRLTLSLAALAAQVVEHLGLGRYGEAIDVDADIDAMRRVAALLRPGGLLLLAVSHSAEDQIVFNAHRM